MAQSKSVCSIYPASEIGMAFDRIAQLQFKTDTHEFEQVLERIKPFFSQDSLKVITSTIQDDSKVLQSGDTFVKYGRRGRPHARFVYISADSKRIVWCVKSFENGSM
jgi:hypothetical protein